MQSNLYHVCAYTDIAENAKLLGFIDVKVVEITPHDYNVPIYDYIILSRFCCCQMKRETAFAIAGFLNTFYRESDSEWYFRVMEEPYIYKNIGNIEGEICLYSRGDVLS